MTHILTSFLVLLSTTKCLAQHTVYVPFGWMDNSPISATKVAVDADGSTTWGLYELPADKVPGPATLVQGVDDVSMIYVDQSPFTTRTMAGSCETMTPIAVCSLELDGDPARITVRPSRTQSGGPASKTSDGRILKPLLAGSLAAVALSASLLVAL